MTLSAPLIFFSSLIVSRSCLLSLYIKSTTRSELPICTATKRIQTNLCKRFNLKTKKSRLFGDLKNFLINLNQICCIIVIMPRGVKKGLNTKKFDRCVTKVRRKSGKVNPYAVCNASMSGKTKHKKRQCKYATIAGKLVYIFLFFLLELAVRIIFISTLLNVH